jgi:hypothetical protein
MHASLLSLVDHDRIMRRSQIIARSNSANTPHISNIARPLGVVVSSGC